MRFDHLQFENINLEATPLVEVEVVHHAFPSKQFSGVGKLARGLWCRTSHTLRVSGLVSANFFSLSFHILRSSIDGAVPTIPG